VNRTCANTPWTLISGAVTESPVSGLAARLGTPMSGYACTRSLWWITSTIRQAMLYCQATANCDSIVGVRLNATTDVTDGAKCVDRFYFFTSRLCCMPNNPTFHMASAFESVYLRTVRCVLLHPTVARPAMPKGIGNTVF
jgi:hypothetical protein